MDEVWRTKNNTVEQQSDSGSPGHVFPLGPSVPCGMHGKHRAFE